MVLSKMQTNSWKKKLGKLRKAIKIKWKGLSIWGTKEKVRWRIKNQKWRIWKKTRRKKIRERKVRARKNKIEGLKK